VSGQKVGQLIDSLGTTAELADGDLATDAVVLLKVVKAEGGVALIKAQSESLDWISSLGMLTAALEIENSGYSSVNDDED
jgi:hypothetical protein